MLNSVMRGEAVYGQEEILQTLKKTRGICLYMDYGLVGSIREDGKEYIVFNYYLDGECVNHKYRWTTVGEDGEVVKRFAQDKDPFRVFFNLDMASTYDEIIIVEGEYDALALISKGIFNVMSVPDGAPGKVNKPKDKPEDDTAFAYILNSAEKLQGKRYVIAVDNDGPGYSLRESLALRLGKGSCDILSWPKGIKDANEFILERPDDDVAAYIAENRKPYPVRGLAAWVEVPEKDDVDYLPCPIPGLDADSGTRLNIGKRNLYVITGIPGHGKSTFARALATGMAHEYGWHICIGSFEDDVYLDLQSELRTMWCALVKEELRGTRVPEYERVDRYLAVEKMFSFVYDEGVLNEPMTVNWMVERMYDAKCRFNMDMMVLDPWNQLDHIHSIKVPEALYIQDALRKFKKAAMDLNIALVIVAHPRKMEPFNGKQERPTLYSISGSAGWNDKPDVGIVVHRPDYHDPESMSVEVHLEKLKRKKLGRRGVVCMEFDTETLAYRQRLRR